MGMYYIVGLWLNGLMVGALGTQLLYSTTSLSDEYGKWVFGINLVGGILMLLGFAVEHAKKKNAVPDAEEAG